VKQAALGVFLCLCVASICLAQDSVLPPNASSRPYWVFLQDRGALTVDPVVIADRLPPEVWARRARAGAPLPDERDLPVWEPYVRQVEAFGHVRHRSHWLNAVSIDLAPAAVAQVIALPFVAGVRPVAVMRAASIGPSVDDRGLPLESSLTTWSVPPPGAPGRSGPRGFDYGPSLDQLEEIGVTALHALGFYGSRVRLMMLDTGFRKDHEAFQQAHILAEWDFVFQDGNVQNEPGDHNLQQNHGTGCWGVAGAFAPGKLIGPAFDAQFVLSKTEDIRSETRAEEDSYVAALEWAETLGVAITSASLTYVRFDDGFRYTFPDKDGDTAVITRAVDIAAAHGILCVNAVGNYGYDEAGTLGTPADADTILSVGAVDSLDVIAWFSACGPTYDGRTKPEVLARGVLTIWADANGPGLFGYSNGTSLATPLVSGAAALLMEAHPDWSAMQVHDALMLTADRADSCDNLYGWGRINAAAALALSPLTYPMPFSLISPTDSSVVGMYQPTFAWHATTDPDQADSVAYTLWLEKPSEPGVKWEFPASTDTVLTVPDFLESGAHYVWYVSAEDSAGNRRLSRETYEFQIDAALQSAEEPLPPVRLEITCSPNPFLGAVSFRVPRVAATLAGGRSAVPVWAVYDALGRRVADGATAASAGGFSGRWDGLTRRGTAADAGIYYVELRLGPRVVRQTLVRIAR
jgi:hypothetical protein